MDEKLIDVFERWLQGRINTCVMGLVSRIERLEAAPAALNSDDLEEKITEIVRIEVESAVKEALDEHVPDMVTNAIEDAELVSHSDMCDFIRNNVRVELDVSRY